MGEFTEADSEIAPQPALGWVWRSRPATTTSGVFSVLAAFEVAIAVLAYWAYALWQHSHVHLFLAIFIAPFLLLRSDKSMAMGVKWFSRYDTTYLYYGDGPYAQNSIKNVISWLLNFSAGLPLALLIRIVATLRHPLAGAGSLSDNWWRTLFSADILTKPEVMPGYHKELSDYDFDDLLKMYSRVKLDLSRMGPFKKSVLLLIEAVWFVTVYGPSYLYRMSIKSTAWAHWPLAYIARPLVYADDPGEVRMRLWNDPREWFRRILMAVTLGGTLYASFPKQPQTAAFSSVPISIVEYAFLIDVRTLFSQPWRVFALIGALITLGLTWYGAELRLLVARSSQQVRAKSRAKKWAATLEYAMRVRDVSGWLFWGLVLAHAGLLLAPSTDWLTGYPLELIQKIYGDFLPVSLRP